MITCKDSVFNEMRNSGLGMTKKQLRDKLSYSLHTIQKTLTQLKKEKKVRIICRTKGVKIKNSEGLTEFKKGKTYYCVENDI